MKHVLEIERKMLLKLFLLLFFLPLATMAWGQSVDNGGGKVHVDTNEGDPGGPWGPAMESVQMCLQHGTCDTLEIEDFLVNLVLLQDPAGGAWPGFSFQILGTVGTTQMVEICIDESALTGEARLYLTNVPFAPPTNQGGSGSSGGDPTEYLSVRVCVSLNCPNCVFYQEEEPNTNR